MAQQKILNRDPRRIGFALGIVCFALFAAGNGWFYNVAKKHQVDAMRSELMRLAEGAARMAPPENVALLRAPEDEQTQAHHDLRENMRSFIMQFPTVSFVYILCRDNEGLYFVMDLPGAPSIGNEKTEAPAKVGDRYEEQIEPMLAVFSEGISNADWEPVADEWGTFLSGYAPIRDATGKTIAIAGVDLQIDDYESRLAGLRSAGLAGILLCFAGAALCGLIASRLAERIYGLEKSFRAMVDDQTELLCRFTQTGEILYANNAFRRFFSTINFSKADHSTLFALLPQAALNSQTSQTLSTFISNHTHGDNTRKWVRWTLRNLDSENASTAPRQLVGHDITAQQNAEDSLRENERRFRLLVQSSSDIIALIDRSGMILYISPNIHSLLGYAPERIHGHFLQDIVHADDHPLSNTLLLKACTHPGIGDPIELRLKRADGQLVHFETIANSQLQSVETRAIILNARDVSERRRIAAERERQSTILRQTQAAARIGSWTYDPVSLELYWTEEMYEIHNVSPTTFKPTLGNAAALYEPASAMTLTEAIDACIELGKPFDIEVKFTDENGRKIHLRALGNATRADGITTGVYGSLQDISERKNAEAEHAALETKIRQTQKLESLGVLSGGIAHDFNNLLTGILGHASLLRSDLTTQPDLADSALQIERTAARASELCKQLLAYSGRGSFDVSNISLNEILKESTSLVRHSISKGTQLAFDLDAAPLHICADRSQILQVVMNLAINASEALQGHDGTITLRTRETLGTDERASDYYIAPEEFSGKFAILEVTDTGCGMSTETLARIFDPFFTTKFTGRGLGLAAVLGIVRAHKGALRVTSVYGKGTTFRILLPTTEATAENLTDEQTPTEWQSHGDILLVDDEEPVRLIVGRMLERIGFTVHYANDGLEGLRRFRELNSTQTLRGVVLDVTMPRMNGGEVLHNIRQIDTEVPVLMISGYSATDLEAHWSNRARTAFLGKPFNATALRTTLQSLMQDTNLYAN